MNGFTSFWTRLRVFAFLCVYIGIASYAHAENYIGSWGDKSDTWSEVYLNSPVTLAIDGAGQLYVADMGNSRIVKFAVTSTSQGLQTKLLARIGAPGSLAGQFSLPFGVAIDKKGNLVVADTANYRIQQLNAYGSPIRSWGKQGTGNGQFGMPREIAIDSANRYFVTDEYNHRVQVFDANGTYLYQFGTFGSGQGQLRMPQGIAIDSKNRVYVADTFNHRIQILTSTGQFIGQIGSGNCADTNVEFCYPRGVGIDASGNLYVADTYNHKVKKYSPTQQYLATTGGYGSLSFPNSLKIAGTGVYYVTDTGNSQVVRFDETATGTTSKVVLGMVRGADGQFREPSNIAISPDGKFYVSDRLNHRIQIFDKNGTLLAKIGKNGSGGIANAGNQAGEFHQPSQVAFDAKGRIFVADSFNSRVQVFDASGKFVASFGGYGFGGGKFVIPMGIAIDNAGNVFVTDWGLSTISKFDANLQFVKTWGSYGNGDGQLNRPIELSVDANGNVYVADTRNGRVQKFDNNGVLLTKWGTNQGVANVDALKNWGTGAGELFMPQGVKVAGNVVYVADTSNNRMQKFDLQGKYLGQWGMFSGSYNGFFGPTSVAVDASGNSYVVDLLLQKVKRFAP
ncbi:MAG: 6-bladed beta-propeller [Burkholderiales bacterium]|nr:6-bladed beta-propeller [Burkholderiales bacterium]